MKSYYEELGLQPDATPEQIREAYRKLAKKYHPDRNPGDVAAETRFKRVSEAYRTLIDPSRRMVHHQQQEVRVKAQRAAKQQETKGFSELFRDFMRKGFGSAEGDDGVAATPPRKGKNLRISLELDSLELAAGVQKTLRVKRDALCEVCGGKGMKPGTKAAECSVCQGLGEVPRVRKGVTQFETCNNCKGSGSVIRERCQHCAGRGVLKTLGTLTVDVPAGTADGAVLTVRGQGNMGAGGGSPGDLQIQIHKRENDYFTRRGHDLVYDYPLTLEELIEGGDIELPAPRGKVRLKLTPGLPQGKVLKVRGKGLPDGEGGQGDILVRIRYQIPDTLTDKARKLLRDLQKQPGFAPDRDTNGFVRRSGGRA